MLTWVKKKDQIKFYTKKVHIHMYVYQLDVQDERTTIMAMAVRSANENTSTTILGMFHSRST